MSDDSEKTNGEDRRPASSGSGREPERTGAPDTHGFGGGPRDIKMPPFKSDRDPDETGRLWQKWKKELLTRFRYFRITNDQDQVDALNIYGGEHVRELIDTFTDTSAIGAMAPSPTAFNDIITALDSHFTPLVNTDSARSKLESMSQREGESIGEYHIRLRMQVSKCGYADPEDVLRSKLLLTMRDGKLRREAMIQRYSLKELLTHAANKEDIERLAQSIEKDGRQGQSEEVHQVYAKKKPKQKVFKPPKNKSSCQGKDNNNCEFCGRNHGGPRSRCPASGQVCFNCSKVGHFKEVCKSSASNAENSQQGHTQRDSQNRGRGRQRGRGQSRRQEHANRVAEQSSSDSEYAFKVERKGELHSTRPTVSVKVNGVKGKVDADTCSTANIIDQARFETIRQASGGRTQLLPTSTKLYAYAQETPVPLIGRFLAEVESVSTGKCVNTEFLVTKGAKNTRPLLSLDTSLQLGVVQLTHKTESVDSAHDNVDTLLSEFKPVFTGLGKHKTIKAKFIVDETVIPVAHKQRRVPFNLEKKARAEEIRLKQAGIIEDVPNDQETTWCTNPVVVPKPHNPDAIRYCSNMRVPNTAIKRPSVEPLSVEDIRFRLNGYDTFSVLDMNEGYHQIELAEESRHLTTFHGTANKMRYTRLNFGAVSSQDIFDKAMDDTIEGLEGVLHIRDDFIVGGKGVEHHDKNLRALLQRFMDCGLTLNPKKCRFRVPEIQFFGFRFSKDGMRPTDKRVKDLKEMLPPANADDIKALLGMAQYSAQFIPRFSQISAPLRHLTCKGAKWKWSDVENKAFQELCDALSDDQVVAYYDVGLETKLWVDAGPHGLGLVLTQKKRHGWQAVACHSRSLTQTEQRYSQMEREALAIRWACERCYKYLIGSTFVVLTDHKPLLAFFNNPNSRAPMRIERWLLYLQQFDFRLEYSPGSENIADYLSRHAKPVTAKEQASCDKREEVVHSLILDSTPKAISLTDLQKETAIDPVLGKLAKVIRTNNRAACKSDPVLREYAPVIDELSIAEGLVLRGSQIVVPVNLRDRVIKLCHEGHLGIVKTKQLLRSKVWFPGIDRRVESEIADCLPCQACVGRKQREPLCMTELPDGPWQMASADFCGPMPTGELLLVMVDAYSRYPEVEIVPSTASRCTIPALEKMFATHGIPQILRTDNGPPFHGDQFKEFAAQKGFTHHRVTPLWPEANGQVERFMRTLGKMMKTAHISGKDWRKEMYTFLANYRATPHPSTGESPYKLSMGRDVRIKIPSLETDPLTAFKAQVQERDMTYKENLKVYADNKRNTANSGLQAGDTVLIRQDRQNKLSSPYEPVKYTVQDVHGSQIVATREGDRRKLVRNSSFCKKVNSDTAGTVVFQEPVPDDYYMAMPAGEMQGEPPAVLHQPPAAQSQPPAVDILPPAAMETPPVAAQVSRKVREPMSHSRTGRPIVKPSWLKDYDT